MTASKRKALRKPKINSKHKDARPTIFHQYWADRICSHIERGWSLRSFCEKPSNPTIKTVMQWLKDEANASFREQYARAREESAEGNFDHIGHLAEKSAHGLIDPQAARVAIDARKWIAGRMKPKKYGDSIRHEGSAPDGGFIIHMDSDDEKLL